MQGQRQFRPGGNFFFDVIQGTNSNYFDCEAIGTAGTHGSGFSANGGTNIMWLGCTAYGLSIGNGFTAYGSSGLQWTSCRSYANGGYGFNVEESFAPVLSNCIAGGKATAIAGTYPYSQLQSLGNAGAGIVFNGSAKGVVNGCHTSYNSSGMLIASGAFTFGPASGTVTGSSLVNNGSGVIILSTAALGRNFKFSNCDISGNTTTALDHPNGYVIAIPGFILPAPPVPANAAAWTNDYPFDVDVYLRGGMGTLVQIDGQDVASSISGAFRVNPGGQLRLFYSTAPSWNLRISG